jgi:ABC-type transport system involved in cytochrome c biogenesis permease component
MTARFFSLLKKEYLQKIRQSETLTGILLYALLFSILLSFLLRHLSVRSDELGIIAVPALWIIFISTVFRYSLFSYSEEVKNNIFKIQRSYGFSIGEIYYAKLLTDIGVCSVILMLQSAVFYLLLGMPQVSGELLYVFFSFLLTVPGVVSLCSLGSSMSFNSGKEEVVMPVLVIPLLLLMSISVVSLSEEVFRGSCDIVSSFWGQTCIGLSVLFCTISVYLFNGIVALRE